jgi:hypothetical protein
VPRRHYRTIQTDAVSIATEEAGAGPKLARWVESGGGRFGTMAITADVNYILVGIMKSGPGAGVESGVVPDESAATRPSYLDRRRVLL